MRDFAITSAKQGVTRLRNKGGASKDSFYTLKDCFVTSDRSIKPRPGTRRDTILPANTKGLMAFRGKLYVFSAEPVTITNPKYANLVLQHPEPGNTAQIRAIHFAQPFLGFPYVVAEFEDDPDTFYHYWLEDKGTWLPETVYMLGESVLPSVQTGYAYSANRLNPASPVWKPGQAVTVGTILEPTVYNGYAYEVIAIDGPGATTGPTEPRWTASEGALVIEDVDVGVQEPDEEGAPTAPYVPPGVSDRYRNQGGFGSWAAVTRVDDGEQG
jgi:hypothetical protein